jgi:hypothetical protein
VPAAGDALGDDPGFDLPEVFADGRSRAVELGCDLFECHRSRDGVVPFLDGDYVVWDRAAEIRFKRPGTETLYATFELPDEEVQRVESKLAAQSAVDRQYTAALVDEDGEVHVTVEHTVHVTTDRGKRA